MKDVSSLIKILLADGSYTTLAEWQTMYGLKQGSAEIGKHFSYTEPRFMQDIQLYDGLIICAPLMMVADRFRKKVAHSVKFNSFNRSEDYQQSLHDRGFKAAKVSPHVVKLAGDIDTETEHQTRSEVKILLESANELNIPIRVGFEQYLAVGQTFIHADVCPLYYAPGKVWHDKPHPEVWEKQITW